MVTNRSCCLSRNLLLLEAVFGYCVALATKSRHAAIVDMPKVVTLTHASPPRYLANPPTSSAKRVASISI